MSATKPDITLPWPNLASANLEIALGWMHMRRWPEATDALLGAKRCAMGALDITLVARITAAIRHLRAPGQALAA